MAQVMRWNDRTKHGACPQVMSHHHHHHHHHGAYPYVMSHHHHHGACRQVVRIELSLTLNKKDSAELMEHFDLDCDGKAAMHAGVVP